MVKYPIRAEEYRARAAAELAASAASPLEHVRTKHVRSAQVWTNLAEAEEARGTVRETRAAMSAAQL
jgi:hypothetical protein